MKRVQVLLFAVLLLFIGSNRSNAETGNPVVFSKISTAFVLSKTVKCDEVKAQFKVYAEGDNYKMALQRLTEINNDFLNFLKKTFGLKEVKTSSAYGYSKTAVMYVTLHTRRIDKIPFVLGYIAGKNFQYKTGIKPAYIRFGLSEELKQKIKNAMFLKALKMANEKLTVVNSILSNGYKIGSLSIGENSAYPVLYGRSQTEAFYKSFSKSSGGADNNIQTSPGSVTIKVKVTLEMIKKID